MTRPAETKRVQLNASPITLGLLASLLVTGGCAYAQPTSSGASGLSWIPGWSQVRLRMAKTQEDMAVIQRVEASVPRATFIVRLSDEDAFKDLAKNFRRNPVLAKSTFYNWCKQHSGLSGLSLENASYSGEIIVGLPSEDPENRSVDDVLEAFRKLDNLVYIEIDAVAHPVEGNTE